MNRTRCMKSGRSNDYTQTFCADKCAERKRGFIFDRAPRIGQLIKKSSNAFERPFSAIPPSRAALVARIDMRKAPAVAMLVLIVILLLRSHGPARATTATAYVRRHTGACTDDAPYGGWISTVGECETGATFDGWVKVLGGGGDARVVSAAASEVSFSKGSSITGNVRGCWPDYIYDSPAFLSFNENFDTSSEFCGHNFCLCRFTANACENTDGTVDNSKPAPNHLDPCICGGTGVCTPTTGYYCNAKADLCSMHPIPTCESLRHLNTLHLDIHMQDYRWFMQSKCGYELIKSTDTNAEKFHFTRAANVCKCPYGTAQVDPVCTKDGEHMCKRCDTGYTINQDKTACTADPCTADPPNLAGIDAAASECENTPSGATCEFVCVAGRSPNGAAKCVAAQWIGANASNAEAGPLCIHNPACHNASYPLLHGAAGTGDCPTELAATQSCTQAAAAGFTCTASTCPEAGGIDALQPGVCTQNNCTCANGTALSGENCTTHGAPMCESCNAGYSLNDADNLNQATACIPDPCAFDPLITHLDPGTSPCENTAGENGLCAFGCDAGFVPTGPAACVAGQWVNNGHVCSDSCVSPDGAVLASRGYDDSGKVETSLSIASFAVTGWQCRAGYDGSVTATVCSGKSHEYSVSGCTQAMCANGVIDVDAATCECDDGFTGGGAWVSGPTYPACV